MHDQQVQIYSNELPKEIQSRMVYGLICMTVRMCPLVRCPHRVRMTLWFNTMIGAIPNICIYITQWSDQNYGDPKTITFYGYITVKVGDVVG